VLFQLPGITCLPPPIFGFFFFVFAASNRISKGNLIEQNKPFSYARIEANTSHYKGGVLSFGLVLRFFGEFPNGPRGCLFSPFLSFFCTDFLVHFTRRSKCAKSLRFLKEGNRDDGEWLPLSKDYHFLLGDIVRERKVERVTLLMSCARNQLSFLYTNKIYRQI